MRGILRVNDHPNGEWRRLEPGADASLAGDQWGGAVCRPFKERGLRVGGAGVGAARVCATGEEGEGRGARISGEDDREVVTADHALGAAVLKTGQVRAQHYRRHRFVRVYTEADVRLLAKVDQ